MFPGSCVSQLRILHSATSVSQLWSRLRIKICQQLQQQQLLPQQQQQPRTAPTQDTTSHRLHQRPEENEEHVSYWDSATPRSWHLLSKVSSLTLSTISQSCCRHTASKVIYPGQSLSSEHERLMNQAGYVGGGGQDGASVPESNI